MEYPISFDDSNSFDKLIGMLKLRIRLMQSSRHAAPDNQPLNTQESEAFEVISRQIEFQLKNKPSDLRAKTEAIIKDAIEVMGKRGFLDFFLVQPLVMGVPYKWFVVNSLICLAAFIATSNFIILFAFAPVLHIGGYLFCQPQHKRQREENI